MSLAILVGEQNFRSPYVRSVLQSAKEQGVLAYVVTAENIIHQTTLPSVIYNRVPTRKEEASFAVVRAKAFFKQRFIPYFNSRFFSKREVDDALRETKQADLLPDTMMGGEDNESVHTMMNRYGTLFLKPVAGSFGEGICRITGKDGQIQVNYRQGTQTVTRLFSTLDEAMNASRQQMGHVPFLIQEEVPLALYAGCKTDFRVHLCRRNESEWEPVAIAAKVGQRDAVTTHVHSGGQIENAGVVLDAWYGRQSKAVLDQLADRAVSVSQTLCNTLPVQLGELGLDMGIDQEGRIYLFEVNAKPGRIIFTHPSLRSAGMLSRQYVLAYAKYLAQKSNAGSAWMVQSTHD